MAETEPTLEESLSQVLGTLPAPVREYLTQGGLDGITRSITAKYNLHIDQGAVVQRELMLVLMGIEQPAELAQALQDEIGLAPEAIKAILEDINKDVFQPLQAKIRAVATEVPAGTPVAPQRPVYTAPPAPPPPPPRPPARQGPPPAPVNLPGAETAPNIGMSAWPAEPVKAPVAQPPQTAPVAVPAPQAQPQAPAPARPIIKEYASDPYHEPIEP